MHPRFGDPGICQQHTDRSECEEIEPFLEAARSATDANREQATAALVDVHHWLTSTRTSPVLSVEDGRSAIARSVAPSSIEDVVALDAWPTNQRVPDVEGPRWDGDVLVYDAINWNGQQVMGARRKRITFEDEGWTLSEDRIDSVPVDPSAASETIDGVFGGHVAGFIGFEVAPSTRLLVALAPAEGAHCVVWVSGSTPTGYTTWAELIAVEPAASELEALTRLARRLQYMSDHQNRRVIEDGSAYRARYRSENWGVERLRVRVDDLEVTHFTVAELESVAGPIVESGVLTAYFEDGSHQPHRMRLNLDDLPEHLPAQLEALAVAREVRGVEAVR